MTEMRRNSLTCEVVQELASQVKVLCALRQQSKKKVTINTRLLQGFQAHWG